MLVSIFDCSTWALVPYQILFVFCFATSSAAAPINNSFSAITSSGDAWAGLVANIAPLLVLLGEKHVKAYFKSMSRQSHFVLYAISPIGLVTAVVTLIRLCGSPLMKRIIGRQFETRAEILADVTSVSYGEVGLRFQGDRQTIEQAISPPPEDETYFGVYMKSIFTGVSLKQDMRDRFEVFGAFDDVTRITDECRIRWYSINVVTVQGWDAQQRSRRLAWHKTKIESRTIMSRLAGEYDLQKRQVSDDIVDGLCSPTSVDPRSTKTQYLDECTVLNATYLEGPGVSPVLTATESLDGSTFSSPNQQNMRYFASLVCAALNIGIIVTDGIFGESTTTLTLISVGIAGAFLGSLITANFIRHATTLSYLSLRGSKVECAGFFSVNDPNGTGLTYSPSTVAISMANYASSSAWASGFTVLLSTLAFISLYLGLRAAAWWVPLAMLGNVALAAFLRAVLGREMNVETVHSKKASQFSRYRRKAALCHVILEQNSNPPKAATSRLNEDDIYIEGKDLAVTIQPSDIAVSGGWTVISAAGRAKSNPCDYIPPVRDLNAADRVVNTLLYNAFNVAYLLHVNSFAPRDGQNASLHKGNFLRSEFLGDTAIWQQPLDLLLPFSSQSSDLILDDDQLAELLKTWITEAFVGDHEIIETVPYSLPQYPIEDDFMAPSCPFVKKGTSHVEEPEILALQRTVRETAQTLITPKKTPSTASWALIWSNKAMLWMAIKLIFASRPSSLDFVEFGRLLQERRKKLVPLAFPRGDVSSMDSEYLVIHYPSPQGSLLMNMEKLVSWYIECLVEGGLVASVDIPQALG